MLCKSQLGDNLVWAPIIIERICSSQISAAAGEEGCILPLYGLRSNQFRLFCVAMIAKSCLARSCVAKSLHTYSGNCKLVAWEVICEFTICCSASRSRLVSCSTRFTGPYVSGWLHCWLSRRGRRLIWRPASGSSNRPLDASLTRWELISGCCG